VAVEGVNLAELDVYLAGLVPTLVDAAKAGTP
jgi:hypothetical protein